MTSDASPSSRRLSSFTVGDWLVEPRSCRQVRGDRVQRLRPQLVDLLSCLAKRPRELLLKEEILAEVWPGQHIAASGLSRCVAELRRALDDDARQPRYIEVIRKRGYRLIAPVVWLEPTSASVRHGGEPGARGSGQPGARGQRDRSRVWRHWDRMGRWARLSAIALVVAGTIFMLIR